MSYYDFYESIRFSLPWLSLKYKNENNIESEEFYLYQLLDDEATTLALNVKLNYHLVGCLARVHGFCFGNYGNALWRVVEQFLQDNNIENNIECIKSKIVKRNLRSVKKEAPEDLKYYIDEMFSNDVKTKEVKLVKEIYKIIKNLQPLKNYDIKLFYNLEAKAIDEIKNNYLESQEIIGVNLESYIPSDMPRLNDELEADIKKEIYNTLEEKFKEYNEKYSKYSLEDNLLSAISYVLDA